MANRRRGEVGLRLGDERYTLCLTLGGLAELEDRFGVADLAALGERLAGGKLGARDVVALLAVGLRGGGHDLDEREVASLPVAGEIEAVIGAVVEMLAAAFGVDGGGEGGPQNPPRPGP